MSTATPALNSFTSGELSPNLEGRIDLKYYAQGCAKLVNFTNLPHGGVRRRSGFRFVHLAGNQAHPSLLISFEYNTEQAYILEFYQHTNGHGRMRVYKDQGLVVTAPATPYELAIPFEPEDFAALRFVQNNNTIYFAHPNYAPRTLTRSSHTSWTFDTPTLQGQPETWVAGNWPSLVCFFESRLCYAATPNEPNTLWFSQTRDYTNFRLNTREVPLTDWAKCYVIDSNADTVKDGKANDTFVIPSGNIFSTESVDLNAVKGTTPSGDIRYFKYLGSKRFSAPSSDKTITFKDSGATGDQVESIYLAAGTLNSTYWEAWEIGDRRTNDEGVPLADDGMEETLDATRPQAISWIYAKDRLWVGTATRTWTFGAASATEGLSPDSVKASPHSGCGSADIDPVGVNASTLFVQRGGQRLREMAYDYQTDSYVTPDKTILSDHMLEAVASQITYVQDPDSIVYVRKADGTLASMTYMPEQDVQGWSRIEANGEFESIAEVFGSVDNRTELWVQTARVVDGGTVRCIEFLEGPHTGDDTTDAFFVDAGVTYDGTATATLTAIAPHLAGATVAVLVDGAVHPDCLVAGDGTVELDYAGSVVHLGLPYTSTLRSMRLEAGSERGTSQTKRKAIGELVVRFLRTLGGKVGVARGDSNNLTTMPFRTQSDPMDAPPPLFSGDKAVSVPTGWNTDCQLVVVQDQPLPMTVLMMVPTVTANE